MTPIDLENGISDKKLHELETLNESTQISRKSPKIYRLRRRSTERSILSPKITVSQSDTHKFNLL